MSTGRLLGPVTGGGLSAALWLPEWAGALPPSQSHMLGDSRKMLGVWMLGGQQMDRCLLSQWSIWVIGSF